MKYLPPKATWHLWLWGIANITLIAYLVFFFINDGKNINGAVQTAMDFNYCWYYYSMLGTLAISSSLRSRFIVLLAQVFFNSQCF